MRTVAASVLALTLALPAACDSTSSQSSSNDAGGGGALTGNDASTDGGQGSTKDASASREVSLYAVIDLPRNASTQSLSGTAFDPATRTLMAIQDKRPTFVPLVGSEDFKSFTVGTPIALSGRTDTAWDGEGIVREGGGFIAITVETAPTVERFDTSGKRTAGVSFPAHFAKQAPGNKGLESLTISPSGRYLFTANESALTLDGTAATKTRGSTVRILRRELANDNDIEVAYRTEPLGAGTGGDMGVAELAAVDDDVLLVLERGYQSDYGNTVRIFEVDVRAGQHVETITSLTDATPVLTKTLLVDVSSLPSAGVTHPSVQPNPILDNYEALAIGPTLPDGRRLLFVTSDDNASATQVARVLVLAVRGL